MAGLCENVRVSDLFANACYFGNVKLVNWIIKNYDPGEYLTTLAIVGLCLRGWEPGQETILNKLVKMFSRNENTVGTVINCLKKYDNLIESDSPFKRNISDIIKKISS